MCDSTCYGRKNEALNALSRADNLRGDNHAGSRVAVEAIIVGEVDNVDPIVDVGGQPSFQHHPVVG